MSDDRWNKEDQPQRPFTKYPPLKPRQFPPTRSSRAPGTPASAEALFMLIEQGKTENGGFAILRKMYRDFTDDELWQAYSHWREGKLHPKLIERRKSQETSFASHAKIKF